MGGKLAHCSTLDGVLMLGLAEGEIKRRGEGTAAVEGDAVEARGARFMGEGVQGRKDLDLYHIERG